jgi:ribosomal protein L7/L12
MQPRLVAAQRQLGFADGATKGGEAPPFAEKEEAASVQKKLQDAGATAEIK